VRDTRVQRELPSAGNLPAAGLAPCFVGDHPRG
jgi:hypothetical protein